MNVWKASPANRAAGAWLDGHYDLDEGIGGSGEGPQPTRGWRLVLEAMENLRSIKN
jgi:hypothetical protein